MIHFRQIHIVGLPVRSRQVLKQEHVEESPQQGVARDKISDGSPFLGEFLLHTADEYPLRFHTWVWL